MFKEIMLASFVTVAACGTNQQTSNVREDDGPPPQPAFGTVHCLDTVRGVGLTAKQDDMKLVVFGDNGSAVFSLTPLANQAEVDEKPTFQCDNDEIIVWSEVAKIKGAKFAITHLGGQL